MSNLNLEEERKRLAEATRLAEEARTAFNWMRRHPEFEPCESNARLIGDWLAENKLPFSEDNLDKAATALGNRLAGGDAARGSFRGPVAVQATPPEPEPLPPLPPHWTVKLDSVSDVRALSADDYRRLYHGKYGDLFRARVEEIYRRAGISRDRHGKWSNQSVSSGQSKWGRR
jgi:hypothetical protein